MLVELPWERVLGDTLVAGRHVSRNLICRSEGIVQ